VRRFALLVSTAMLSSLAVSVPAFAGGFANGCTSHHEASLIDVGDSPRFVRGVMGDKPKRYGHFDVHGARYVYRIYKGCNRKGLDWRATFYDRRYRPATFVSGRWRDYL
jgi:hypothetical protein